MTPDNEIISRVKDPAVAAARRRIGQMGREPAAAFLVDGRTLVTQALAARAPVEAVFFLAERRKGGRLLDASGPDPVSALSPEQTDVLEHARRADVACHLVSRGVFFRILGLGYETAVRVLAVVDRPELRSPVAFVSGEACFLVGERIQDPRNVGVLIRTAEAGGAACAVFSEDSADAYSRAAVRSSTGSIFRVPVVAAADLADCLKGLKAKGVRIVGTSAQVSVPCREADLTGPCAVVLGNETTGLSPEVRACCDDLVTIPMLGGAHSFNVTVAGGIILYERVRQMNDTHEGVEL